MNSTTQTRTGLRPIGGANPKNPGLKIEIEGRAFSQATQAEPIPLVWGTVQRAGTYIVPPFGLRSEPVYEKMGK